MAEITRRRTGEFLRVLFIVLLERPEGLQARDALTELERRVKLTEYESGNYESGGRRFEKIVRFATVDCVKAGWLLKHKGKWSITDQGKQAHDSIQDPEAFYKQAVKLYHQWKAIQPSSPSAIPDDVPETPGIKTASVTYEEAEEQAWSEIEQYLHKMNPYEFQELVASLLRAMSYHVAWVSPPGKDGGIDIVAWGDPLGTRPPRIKVQVKRITQSVTVDGLRSFLALLGDDDVGLFVSAGGFTKDASELARTQEKRKITLVDLERLFDLWVQHYDRLEDSARRRLPLQPIYFLAPEG